MDVSDPGSLGSALGNLLTTAGTAAQQAPTQLSKLFDQVPNIGNGPQPWPSNLIDPLNKAVDPPDWWSLLVFVLVWIQNEVNDPALWIGAQKPDGWSRMLTLNYSPGATKTSVPEPVVTVGVAVTDPNLTRGIWINLRDDINNANNEPTFATDHLSLTLSGHGSGTWNYQFGGGLSPVVAGVADSLVKMQAGWDPQWDVESKPLFDVKAGKLLAAVQLNGPTPSYSVEVGLGPLEGKLSPAAALGALASAVHIDDFGVSYQPQLVLAPPLPPSFTLNG